MREEREEPTTPESDEVCMRQRDCEYECGHGRASSQWIRYLVCKAVVPSLGVSLCGNERHRRVSRRHLEAEEGQAAVAMALAGGRGCLGEP